MNKKTYTINVGGQLMSLEKPVVMGILNVTDNSFYAASRAMSDEQIRKRALQIVEEGASIVDLGACSTKPGAAPVSEEEEMERLGRALEVVREAVPETIVSVDTYRARVAERCVKEYGAHIINDISGGDMDEAMFETVAALKVPYILMHIQGTPETMQLNPTYDNLWCELNQYLAERINRLHLLGVNDVIIDPGFGFGKTVEDNYFILNHLEDLMIHDCPLLVGVSRKSMIYKLLGTTPEGALNGTTAVHVISLMHGAHILRVHDVKEAVEAVRIVEKTREA